MGFFARILDYTPLGKYYREYNKRKWEEAHSRMEQKLFPGRVAFYRQFIKPGDLVFDIGANIGNRVEVFLECGAKVIAVEPQPGCADILRSKFGNNILIEQVGLSETEGELEMHIASDSTVSTFNSQFIEETRNKFRYTEWRGTIKVPITTLDHLLQKHGIPRLCKIDVEGFELQVLKGLHIPIPVISVEYIVPERSGAAQNCVQLLHQLSSTGQFNYSVGESMNLALKDWMDFRAFSDHIQSREFSNTSFGDIYFRSIPEK